MKTESMLPIIVTEDIEGTINFYSTVFDYTVKNDFKAPESGVHVMILSNPNGDEIELIEKKADLPSSILSIDTGIIGFHIDVDDIEEAKREAEKMGCTVMGEIYDTEICRIFFMKDNNGIHITLSQYFKEN